MDSDISFFSHLDFRPSKPKEITYIFLGFNHVTLFVVIQIWLKQTITQLADKSPPLWGDPRGGQVNFLAQFYCYQ